MISIDRKENKVLVKVQHGIFYGTQYFELEINQAYEYQAELLRIAIQENLNKHLTRIKEDYYNKGWKDAKAKVKKRTYFLGGWNS